MREAVSHDTTTIEETIDLSRFDGDYQRAELTNDPPGHDIPDGLYSVSIEEVRLGKTQSTGNPMITWKMRILAPVAQDRMLWKFRVITDKTLPWVKEDLAACGVNLTKLSDLPLHLDQMRAVELSIVKRTQVDGRANIFFQRTRRSAPEMDDDLPF